jgi:hypothetical protein
MPRLSWYLVALVAGGWGRAQGQTTTRTFLLMSGADTIAVEAVRRTAGRLEGELVFRSANQRWHYVATISANERVTTLENEFRLATDAASAVPKQSARLAFEGDSVFVTFSGPTPPPQRLRASAGAIPYINPSFAMVEQALRQARKSGRGDATVSLFAVTGGQTFPGEVRWIGTDSVEFSLAGTPSRLAVAPDGSILGGWVPSQKLTITVVTGSADAALRVAKPDYSAPADVPYTAESVRVPTPKGHVLAGTLTIPKGARGRVPAIVTITGSGSQERDEAIPAVRGYRPFRDIADALGRRGIAVLRMDDRGAGESGGDAASATSVDFAADIAAGVSYLRTRSEIDGARLGLVGHSEGGIIAPQVASADPAIRGIVLLAGPAYTGRRIIEFQNRYAIERSADVPATARDSLVKAALRSVDSAAAVQPWLKYFLDYDPTLVARTVRTPVLILQGATDRQVTAEQAPLLEAAFKAGGNADVTIRVFPEINHLFLADQDGSPAGYSSLQPTTVRPEVLRMIGDWLSKRL